MKQIRLKILKMLVITVAIIGGLALNTSTAQSKGFTWLKTKDYSANPPVYVAKNPGQSVSMWNWNHTRKLHNLRNYPKTKWSVMQSVKMYNPKKTWGKKTGIYYKLVKGTKVGYVHRNFLKRDSTDNGGGSTDSDDGFSPVSPKLIDKKLNQELIDLFPGTVKDSKLQKIAEQDAVNEQYGDNDRQTFNDLTSAKLGNNFIELDSFDSKDTTFIPYTTWATKIKQGKISFQNFARQTLDVQRGDGILAEQQPLPKSFDFTNYKIGAYVMPLSYWNDEDDPFVVLLLPSK